MRTLQCFLHRILKLCSASKWGLTSRKYQAKICTKYRKHWESNVSFQLSLQTVPFLAVLRISSILKKYPRELFFHVCVWFLQKGFPYKGGQIWKKTSQENSKWRSKLKLSINQCIRNYVFKTWIFVFSLIFFLRNFRLVAIWSDNGDSSIQVPWSNCFIWEPLRFLSQKQIHRLHSIFWRWQ